jgi:hypothetical protein
MAMSDGAAIDAFCTQFIDLYGGRIASLIES